MCQIKVLVKKFSHNLMQAVLPLAGMIVIPRSYIYQRFPREATLSSCDVNVTEGVREDA